LWAAAHRERSVLRCNPLSRESVPDGTVVY
jgi:hypothetical protein